MEQLPLPLPYATARGAEDFLVTPGNRSAVDWIGRWPDWPFTALILVGPAGSGKTHLAGLWRGRSDARAVALEGIGLEEIAAIAGPGRTALVDDCDRAAGDPAAELALLQLHNLMRAAGGHLLLTAGRPASAWPVMLPDLASRLNAAMVATLDPPDDALLAAVAVKLFADRQLRISPGVIPLLLTHGRRSFAGLAKAVDALDRISLAGRREITPALARGILLDLAGGDPGGALD
jgi:chromosomal replication initiation ATPase DnaA